MPLIILALGVGIIGLAIGSYIVLRGNNDVNDRIEQFIGKPSIASASSTTLSEVESDDWVSRFRRQFNLLFSVLNSGEMQRKLIAGNWPVTVSEYLFLQAGATILSFLLGLLIFRSVFPGAGLAILAYAIPGYLLFRSVQARQKLFQSQLIDALTFNSRSRRSRAFVRTISECCYSGNGSPYIRRVSPGAQGNQVGATA